MTSAAVPPELIVYSDNSVLRRRFRNIMIMHGALTVLFLVGAGFLAMTTMDAIRPFTIVWLIMLAGQVFQIAFQCYHWGGRLAISQPLTLNSVGLEFQGQQGTVLLPWAAITQVRRKSIFGNRLVAFMIHPQAVPGQNGVEADPAYWRRYQKYGLQIGERGLVPGLETILPAVQHYSQGRVPIS